jgi:hypothetical protein
MKQKTIELENNKLIHVFDDLFTFAEINNFEKFINNSVYKVNGADDSYNAESKSQQIFSNYSFQDIENMQFIKSHGYEYLQKEFNLDYQKTKQIRVNLTTPSERNYLHHDGLQGKTLLYYPNSLWKIEWGGHTLFMDENLEDTKYACLYKPGRVVLFDSPIPHMILTPNIMTPVNRYSLVLQYL